MSDSVGTAQKDVLIDGYYVGVRVSARNYSFKAPKVKEGAPVDLTLDQLWQRLSHGAAEAPDSRTPVNNAKSEKTTRFSGWQKVTAAKQTSDKAFAAPEIYRAAGGDDFESAQECVKKFKKTAARVLGRCADNGIYLDESIEREINVDACVVHEVKVLMLNVSSIDNGGRFDEHTKKWYAERTMRKFYLLIPPTQDLITRLAVEIADSSTNVNAEGKLVVVREDGVTPNGRRSNNFRIVNLNSYGEGDEGLKAVVDRLRSRIITS